jgi:hypothetical protein
MKKVRAGRESGREGRRMTVDIADFNFGAMLSRGVVLHPDSDYDAELMLKNYTWMEL